jgi:dihydroflavonol-4-reductase
MRALVIGGTGFIGVHIVDTLLALGATVRVTRRKQTPTILLQKRAIEWAHASLQEPEALWRAMVGCDVVFLCGAYYPRYSLDLEAALVEAVTGVRHACEAALSASVPRFVYTSTLATLAAGPAGRLADERDVAEWMPRDSVYRAVKWSMEREVERARCRGLSTVTLMPGGCIGPGDVRLGTGSLLVGVVGAMLPWWVDGLVNLVDVGDVARAHVVAAMPTPSHRYCLGGHELRVPRLLRHIAARYGGLVPDVELCPQAARSRADADESAAAPLRRRVPIPREFVDIATSGQSVSSARARSELGFTISPLDDSLDRAHAWFARHSFLAPTERERKEIPSDAAEYPRRDRQVDCGDIGVRRRDDPIQPAPPGGSGPRFAPEPGAPLDHR